jgi:U3 small nucleolar RNA-associated protein 19
LTGNILSLILPLHNLPQNAEDINEFYLPHLSKKPSKTSASSKKTAKPSKNGSKPNAQSWMDFFESSEDESSEEEQIEIEVDKKTGNKKKRMKKVKVKKDVHSLVWSVQSQKKVFTDCWLALLGLP